MKDFLGYQVNQYFDYGDTISLFLNIAPNNIGDPFQPGRYAINSKEMEYGVIRYYAKLWDLPLRDINKDKDPNPKTVQDPNVYWGYVLSMGSSEGNIMASWIARDYIGGKLLIIDEEVGRMVPVVGQMLSRKKKDPLKTTVYFTSEAAHYSVIKSAVLMNVRSFGDYGNEFYPDAEIPGFKKQDKKWNLFVPPYWDFDGRVDVDILVQLVDFFAQRNHGIIVVLNYGTTFTGAFDDIATACERLRVVFKKYGLDKV